MSQSKKELKGAVEALLFVSDEPLKASELAKILKVSEKEVEKIVQELSLSYERKDRGIRLRQVARGFRLYSSPDYASYIQNLLAHKDHRRLTQAALETLAIIAYKQPVTKAEISAIRGVSSEGVVATLLRKELIKEVGRAKAPGNPVLYGTTAHFLESLGLNSLADLPPLDEIAAEVSREEREELDNTKPRAQFTKDFLGNRVD
jgi:segregation and condensation protein B